MNKFEINARFERIRDDLEKAYNTVNDGYNYGGTERERAVEALNACNKAAYRLKNAYTEMRRITLDAELDGGEITNE